MQRRLFLVSIGAWMLAACGRGGGERTPTPAATRTTEPTRPSATVPPTSTATLEPSPTATVPPVPRLEPIGFPLATGTRLGLVSGPVGSRSILWGEGPTAIEYSRDDQPSDDPVRANSAGWNARVHVEYEGQPAVDWYVPVGTPILATMDGVATLMANTVSNPFDVYGVSREPFLGNPDRSRAGRGAFPGPGGGQGIFVRIANSQYRTDSAHLEIAATIQHVPATAWLDGYSPDTDFATTFAPLRDFRIATELARWEVRTGDVIGMSGDSGYSEAPHLHYAIRPAGSANALCPTTEPGFENNGWLFQTT